MIRKTVYFILFLAAFPQGQSLFAQDAWNLEKCITYALDHNIRIRQQEINTRYNDNVLYQSKADLYPDLNAGGSYGASFGRALDQTTYEFTQNQTVQSLNLSLNSSVTLFSGFQKVNTIRQNEMNLQASLQDLDKLKNDVSLNIAAAYLQILLNKELLNVANDQKKVTTSQVDRTRALVDAGSVAMGTLLEMQSQEAADEVRVVNAQNNLDISYLTLTQLLELDSAGNFSIVIPEIPSVDESALLLPVEDIYRQALANLPEIQSSRYQLKSSEKGLDIAKGSRSPRVGLSASYGTGYSDIRQLVTGTTLDTTVIGYTTGGENVFSTYNKTSMGPYPLKNQLKDNASTSVFLNVSMPIFSNFRINNNISNAKLMVENSKLDLENQKKILYKQIQQAYADANAALKKYRSSEKAVASMQESFKYTKEKYEVGLVNAVDFNVAQSQYITAQSDLLQSKYDYIFKTNILNFYMGLPIKLDF
ncbi:MAG TPA: TolC family protein [Bacteroidales bacterium]|nr:TolC family protein [Bacteroidales bacterium]